MRIRLLIAIVLGVFLLSSCEQKKEAANNNLTMATLYNYYAAEYEALAYQAFNIGKKKLLITRLHNPTGQNLAVVVDIDETILDNSPYEAKTILDRAEYSSDTWHEWCNLASATAVPGAIEFLNFADSLNYKIFYLSNRKKKFVQESTMENLKALGFPQITEKQFLLRDSERSKEKRREKVMKKHKIVLFAGDNLGDFYDDSSDFTSRAELMQMNKDKFGETFIVLPNAMYGEWVSSLEISGNKNKVDSLLHIMTKAYPDH